MQPGEVPAWRAGLWLPLGATLELALPRRCAGCGQPGDALCAGCRCELAALVPRPARVVAPRPCPAGFPPTWSQGSYDGALAALLRAYKDGGRVDVAPVLAVLLRGALAGALTTDARLRIAAARCDLLAVAVPTSARARRSRGRDPIGDLLGLALRGQPAVRPTPALRIRRKVADQAGLGATARTRNLHGAMTVRSRAALDGAVCVVVDDIVTTGSTLTEAARVLRAAGASHIGAVTVAATRRRRRP